MASLVSLTVLVFLFTGIRCLRISGSLQDGQVVHACAGSDITLPWTILQENQDIVTSTAWFFEGRSQEMIAMLSQGVFAPLPAFSHRVEHDSDGTTVVIRHVTPQDSGNYSLEVHGYDANGLAVSLRHTIYVEVADVCSSQGPQTSTATLTGSGSDLRDRLALLEAQQTSLRTDLSHLTAVNSVLTADVHQLTADNRQLTADNLRLAQDVSSLQREVTQLAQTGSVSQPGITTVNDTGRHDVSFHAKMSLSQTVRDDSVLNFANVLSNHGNAFNGATGVFTAPYDGTYFFIASMGSNTSDYDAHLELVVGGNRVGHLFAHRTLPYVEMGTCHAVVHLTPGQRVWIQSVGESSFYLAYGYISGFLIMT